MKKVSLLILTFISINVFSQQVTYSEVIGTPFDGVRNSSVAFTDVNGNTYQDLLITGEDNSSVRIAKLYTNDGTGTFTEVIGTPFDEVFWSSVAFADVNGNSYQDVLITGSNSSNDRIAKLYTNDGSGDFTEVVGTPFDGVQNSFIAFADVNGNSYQDVLITGQNSSFDPIAKLYTNDGSGDFTEVVGTPFDGVQWSSIAFADVNSNTYQDVLITGQNSSSDRIAKLYTNDGNGNFTEVIGTPFDGVWASSIAFADVNGNGYQDVLITGQNSSFNLIAKLYTNDGNGNFTEVIGTPFDGVQWSSIAFADVNNNGYQDVLITGINSSNIRISKLYLNNGTGNFTEFTGTPFDGVRNSSIAFADVNGNGSQDVLISGQDLSNVLISKLYIQTDNGNISATITSPNVLTLCEGETIEVDFNVTENDGAINTGNQYTLELSDASGSFMSPTVIGTLNSSSLSGTISGTIPGGLSGTAFRVRINASDDIMYGDDNGVDITINPNPTPVISISPTDPSVCDGADGIISVSSMSGSTSGDVNWSGTASGSDNSIGLPYDITGLSAGNYDVIFTDDNGCVSNTESTIITNPDAPVLDAISDTSSCEIDFVMPNPSTYITGANLSGDQSFYSSSGGDSADELTQGTVITSAMSPMTIFTYDNSGTCDSEVSFTIYVYENPEISILPADTIVCEGDTLTLTADNPNGANISWDGGVVDGEPFTVTSTQNYEVTAELNGCSSTDIVQVTVIDTPDTPTITVNGDGDLEVSIDPGQTVEWYLDGVLITGQNGSTLTPTANGDYTAIVVDGSCSSEESNVFEVDFVNIESFSMQQFTVYPNPTNESLTIQLDASLNKNSTVEVYDVSGKIVLSKPFETQLSVQTLDNGVYFLRISGIDQRVKFIKQ